MSHIHARTLLSRAHAELDHAQQANCSIEQFLSAHMAALRGAAAVVALVPVAGSPRSRRKVRSVWEQLSEAGPQWTLWVDFYRASADTRAGIESGQVRRLEASDSQAAVDTAGRFLAQIGDFLSQQSAVFEHLAQAS